MPALRSGPLAAWTRAWIAGRVSLDQAVDAVADGDAPHQVVGLSGSDDPVALREVLVAWRRSGARVEVALPVPGDVRGVPGPLDFRAAALAAGEAIAAPGLGLVPEVTDFAPSSAPSIVVWQAYATDPPPPDPMTVKQAHYDLATAIRESASALVAADVSGAAAEVAGLLGGALRAGDVPNLPPGSDAPAVALLAQAERLQAVLDLVSADPFGGASDVRGIAARAAALRPLATAVRRARIAAYNA